MDKFRTAFKLLAVLTAGLGGYALYCVYPNYILPVIVGIFMVRFWVLMDQTTNELGKIPLGAYHSTYMGQMQWEKVETNVANIEVQYNAKYGEFNLELVKYKNRDLILWIFRGETLMSRYSERSNSKPDTLNAIYNQIILS